MYWQGVMLDITDLKEAQRELAETQAKYKAIVEDIPAIVYIDEIDDDMSTSFVSPQIQELLGVTAQDYIDDPDLWYRMLHPEDKEEALARYLHGRDSGESFEFEYRLIGPNDRTVWFRDSAVVIRDEHGTPTQVQGVMLDMTGRKEAEERAAFLAYHDKLTGLPNRIMFEELLELAIARAKRHEAAVAVVYTDIDDFKLVNDSLGHELGDELLKQLSERLREATRETDLVARQGGDEFLLLLSDLERTPDGVAEVGDSASMVAESVATRVQQSLEEPFLLNGTEVYVSASVGVSLFPGDADDAATLLKHADQAMYRSKRTGPGGMQFHTADSADAMSRLALTTRLRKAVEQQDWELHYQPIVDLDKAEMVGVEALIRWPDPNGGLVPPGDFIPLAEEMGLIEAIGDWVVEEVARQDVEWREQDLRLELGFNLSPRQLWQPDLSQKIIGPAGCLRRRTAERRRGDHRIDGDDRPGSHTAHLARTARSRSASRDRRLRHGILVSVASQAPARRHPQDRPGIRARRRQGSQCRQHGLAMIALAGSLGMTPLAEGIETEEEWSSSSTMAACSVRASSSHAPSPPRTSPPGIAARGCAWSTRPPNSFAGPSVPDSRSATPLAYDSGHADRVRGDRGREPLLHRVIETISSSLDLDVVLDETIDLVMAATRGDACFLHLYDAEREHAHAASGLRGIR